MQRNIKIRKSHCITEPTIVFDNRKDASDDIINSLEQGVTEFFISVEYDNKNITTHVRSRDVINDEFIGLLLKYMDKELLDTVCNWSIDLKGETSPECIGRMLYRFRQRHMDNFNLYAALELEPIWRQRCENLTMWDYNMDEIR